MACTSLSIPERTVALPEIISALSFALDLTEGALPGHALRCCLLGMRLAEAMEVPSEQLTALYYALQLKDVGCSSNATRMTQIIGGDDRTMKASTKLENWRKIGVTLRGLKVLWRNILPDKSILTRVEKFCEIARHTQTNREEMIQLRCERGALIVRKLEMDEMTAEAVRRLDEHWDGGGCPDGLKGEEISLLSRICSVAQNLDVFAIADGCDAALAVVRKRSGSWFDPAVVAAAEKLHIAGKLWSYCRPECPVEVTRRAVMQLEPKRSAALAAAQIDVICEAFADVVDAKSPFTFRHSQGVAEVAEAVAQQMQLPTERVRLVRRAALMHDLGKLGIPNTILDKNGALTAQERAVVEEHPFLSRTILERVDAFDELSMIAGEHHEKLDGSGYPLGVRSEELCIESRIVATADFFAALAEDRPYRAGMQAVEILTLMAKDVPARMDATCFAALQAVVKQWGGKIPASFSTPVPGQPCEIPRVWSGVRAAAAV